MFRPANSVARFAIDAVPTCPRVVQSATPDWSEAAYRLRAVVKRRSCGTAKLGYDVGVLMKDLIQKLGPIVLGSATVVANLRKLLAESRPNGADARIDAIEDALQIQSTLNESVDVQVRLIHELLKKTQKRLQLVIVALIAMGTVAALALAVAVIK